MALAGSVLAGAAAARAVEPMPTPGATARPGTPDEQGVIDPRADTVLHRMSGYLAARKSFRVDTVTVDEHVTAAGQKIQEIKESKVAIKRPNAIAVDRLGPSGRVQFRYDGKRFGLYGLDKNVYASSPAPTTLDAAIDDARDRLQIDAPGGDLMVSDPYHALLDGVTVGRYIGLEPMGGGVMAHHLAMTKRDVDWQIWIQDGPEPLPLRYVITTKNLPGQPQFTLELRHWQLDVPLSDSSFALIVPPGARQIELAARRAAQP
jgi:hypothetical protein